MKEEMEGRIRKPLPIYYRVCENCGKKCAEHLGYYVEIHTMFGDDDGGFFICSKCRELGWAPVTEKGKK